MQTGSNFLLRVAISAAVVLLSGLAGIFLNYIEDPATEYRTQAARVEKNRRDRVAGTIGQIVAEAHEYVESVPEEQSVEDFGQEKKATVIIQNAFAHADGNSDSDDVGINQEHLSNLSEDVEYMAEPISVYDSCRAYHRNAFYLFVASVGLGLISALVFLFMGVGTTGQQLAEMIPYHVVLLRAILFFSLLFLGFAVYQAFSWNISRNALDDMLEESTFILDSTETPLRIRITHVIYLYSIFSILIFIGGIWVLVH